MNFYWFKAHPGAYYLYDKPRVSAHVAGDRAPVASVKARREASYLITINLPEALLPTGWGYAPKTALAEAESQVLALVPAATFSRENF